VLLTVDVTNLRGSTAAFEEPELARAPADLQADAAVPDASPEASSGE
jgi:hypothetical protein